MDIRFLRAFIAVFEERNITQAAARLCVTQPTLSATLRQLEEELETELFVRLPRGVEANDAARRLYPEAKRLCAEVGTLVRQFREPTPSLELTIGIEGDVGSALIQQIAMIAASVNRLQLTLAEGCCGDLRLGCETLRCEDELFLPLWEEEYVLALPPQHPLAQLAEVAPEQLASQSWIICPNHSSHQRLLAILASHAPRQPQRADSLRLAAELVGAGLGVAWLPESLSPMGLGRLKLVAPSLKRRLGICYAANAITQPAVAAFLAAANMLKESSILAPS